MLRTLTAVAVAALVLLTSVGGAVAGSGTSRTLTLSGRMEYVTTQSVPHYEVAGYIVLYRDTAQLKALSNQEVVVVGTEVDGPTIFMQKVIEVQSIRSAASAPSTPSQDDQQVTIPVLPQPAPAPAPGPGDEVTVPVLPGSGHVISVPAQPAPFFGTSFYVLFGRLDLQGDRYVLVQETPIGRTEAWVRSTALKLTDMVGQQVGLIAARETLPDGQVRYQIQAAVVLTGDMAQSIQDGTSILFTAPHGEITVKLRGRIVHMDQAPVLGNGRTLIGLRTVAEALGASVTWDPATRTATVQMGDRQVIVRVGSNLITIRQPGQDDVTVFSDVTPIIAGGRTMVPLRAISESLGLQVDWSGADQTVTIQ